MIQQLDIDHIKELDLVQPVPVGKLYEGAFFALTDSNPIEIYKVIDKLMDVGMTMTLNMKSGMTHNFPNTYHVWRYV